MEDKERERSLSKHAKTFYDNSHRYKRDRSKEMKQLAQGNKEKSANLTQVWIQLGPVNELKFNVCELSLC